VDRKQSVLIADADEDTRALYGIALRLGGFDVMEAADGRSALTRALVDAPSLVLTELALPESSRPTALAWAYGMVGAVQAAGDWWLQNHEVPRSRLVTDLCELLTRGWVDTIGGERSETPGS